MVLQSKLRAQQQSNIYSEKMVTSPKYNNFNQEKKIGDYTIYLPDPPDLKLIGNRDLPQRSQKLSLINHIEKICETITSTLGADGRPVIINMRDERGDEKTVATLDGYTVSKSLKFI
jgi:hypothetical protein